MEQSIVVVVLSVLFLVLDFQNNLVASLSTDYQVPPLHRGRRTAVNAGTDENQFWTNLIYGTFGEDIAVKFSTAVDEATKRAGPNKPVFIRWNFLPNVISETSKLQQYDQVMNYFVGRMQRNDISLKTLREVEILAGRISRKRNQKNADHGRRHNANTSAKDLQSHSRHVDIAQQWETMHTEIRSAIARLERSQQGRKNQQQRRQPGRRA